MYYAPFYSQGMLYTKWLKKGVDRKQ